MSFYAVQNKQHTVVITIYEAVAKSVLETKGLCKVQGPTLALIDEGYEIREISEDAALVIIRENVELHDLGRMTEQRLIAKDIAQFRGNGIISFGGLKDVSSRDASTLDVRTAKKTG